MSHCRRALAASYRACSTVSSSWRCFSPDWCSHSVIAWTAASTPSSCSNRTISAPTASSTLMVFGIPGGAIVLFAWGRPRAERSNPTEAEPLPRSNHARSLAQAMAGPMRFGFGGKNRSSVKLPLAQSDAEVIDRLDDLRTYHED